MVTMNVNLTSRTLITPLKDIDVQTAKVHHIYRMALGFMVLIYVPGLASFKDELQGEESNACHSLGLASQRELRARRREK